MRRFAPQRRQLSTPGTPPKLPDDDLFGSDAGSCAPVRGPTATVLDTDVVTGGEEPLEDTLDMFTAAGVPVSEEVLVDQAPDPSASLRPIALAGALGVAATLSRHKQAPAASRADTALELSEEADELELFPETKSATLARETAAEELLRTVEEPEVNNRATFDTPSPGHGDENEDYSVDELVTNDERAALSFFERKLQEVNASASQKSSRRNRGGGKVFDIGNENETVEVEEEVVGQKMPSSKKQNS